MKTLIVTILLPPGIGLILAVLAFIFFRSRPRLARGLLALGIIVGWSLSTEAMGRFLSAALVAQVEMRSDVTAEDVDMIVVLTGGMHYAGEVGWWQPRAASYRRGAVAYNLQNQIGSRTPILISGGHTHGLKYPSEAEVLQRQFDRHQAQITPVILEEAATNTYESALQSMHILKQHEADTVILVTSEVHMLRALAAFRSQGVDPIPVPVIDMQRGPLVLQDFLPSPRGVEITSKAIYEILGLVEYVVTEKVKIDDIFYTAQVRRNRL